ncbi:MAG: DUF6241 domain-containing protein [Planococcus sp. (in: firmicutes)]|uniref:DUF6241 domain-containing protein n=1 Tax=Planococcus halocryophilus TaxID=1215089 RepID=UPI001F0F0135|nr:DUF6241 domain-containing protein [Planococcus halocryophilus]MCH4827393.1 DUF6241 domain-containing protein [Planococcus halocryophilus]
MKSLLKTSAITIGVLALLVAGGYYFIIQNSSKGGDITKVAEEIEKSDDKAVAAEKDDEKVDRDDLKMSEVELQIYMHKMTHQKITASEKKGAVEMTAEHIDGLLTIVNAYADQYEHSDFYLATLEKWKEGNFSNAVNVHNTIWDWHNGTVGRATGFMTPEQEQDFVERMFR